MRAHIEVHRVPGGEHRPRLAATGRPGVAVTGSAEQRLRSMHQSPRRKETFVPSNAMLAFFASRPALYRRSGGMGLGPTILGLYRQLKILGAFEGVNKVIELGSQGVWCPDRRLLLGLYDAFGRQRPPKTRLHDTSVQTEPVMHRRGTCMRALDFSTSALILMETLDHSCWISILIPCPRSTAANLI